MWLIFMVNVGKYTIHGSSGVGWFLRTLRIIGPVYRVVWMCIAGVWDLQITRF